jgi:hypothetical protein
MRHSLPYKRALVYLVVSLLSAFVIALAAGLAQSGNSAHWAVSTKNPVATPGLPGKGRPPFGRAVTLAERPEIHSSASEMLQMLPLDASSIFLAAQTYSSGGEYAQSIAVGDVNGDGKQDLVVANSCDSINCTGNGVVGVLLGNGDGTFQAPMSYDSGGYGGGYNVTSVAVADVNGDGKPDLLVANSCASGNSCSSGIVGVLLNNGDGTFQAAVTYSSGGNHATSLAVADVNGDGKPDLLVANSCDKNCVNGSVTVLLGNGDGSFRAAVSYGSGGYDVISVVAADLNGDGKLDLLVANQCAASGTCPYGTNGTVGVLMGKGDGTFQTAVTYSSGGYSAESMALGDVNGDGKPDLVVSNACGDIYCTKNENGTVGVLLGNGDGTFRPAVTSVSGALTARSVVAADVNGDGKLDLLVAATTGATGVVSVLSGNGDGTFRAPVMYASGGLFGLSVVVADVNGDGKPDLLVANECAFDSNVNCGNPAGMVGVLLGNGDGTFQAAVTYSSGGGGIPSVAVGDVNGDGKADLILADACVGGYCGNTVGVQLGYGDGSFQAPVSYGSGGYGLTSVAVADVNGDGKLDLLATNNCVSSSNCSSGILGVLLNNGDGTFQAAVSYGSGGQYAESVAMADVNGDGKPDLVVANQCASSNCTDNSAVGVLLGNGDGTFQAAVSYGSGGHYSYSLAVADVNGDGKPDILVLNECASSSDCSSGGVVGVLLGNGDGTFQPTVTYNSGGYAAYALAVGDVNNDGKLDLVVASLCASNNCTVGANGGLGVLLGNGDGTFQAATTVTTPPITAGPFVLADFNGDGNLDVASAVGDYLLLGNGDGTFQPAMALGGGGVGVAVGDFNGDGRPDLAIGGLTILLNIATHHPYSTTAALTSSVNPSGLDQPVTFTATITPQYGGKASGTVTFKDGSTPLGSGAVSGNVASLTTSGLAIGTHPITAVYSGDSNFMGSTSNTLSQIVTRATTTTSLASSMNPSVSGKSVTFTAVVSSPAGTPTGKVKYLNGTTLLATLTLTSGSAKYTTSKLPPGANSITAVYGGDSNNNSSTSSPVNQFVLAATTTTLTSSPNPSAHGQGVVFTATVGSSIGFPSDGETVTFKKGTTVLGTGTLNGGSAGFTTSALKVGPNSITAVYGGDSNFAGSTSKAVSQVVNKATTTTTLSSSLNPSNVGQSVTFTANVKPQFSGTVTGSVTFYDGATALKTVALSGGVAKFTTSTLSSGSHNITATYNGSTNFTGSSASLTQTVN